MSGLNTMLISLTILFSLIFSTSNAQTCTNYTFSSNKIYSSCNDLPVLNAYLHWNYNSTSKTMDIAFRHTNMTSSKWVAWGINPTAKGMIGTQALVAFQDSNGTLKAFTSSVTGYTTQLQQGNLTFGVPLISAQLVNNEITIFATLELLSSNTSTITQLWQEGPVKGDSLMAHVTSGDNIKSVDTLDLLSGQATTTLSVSGGNSRQKRKNVHGVLNAISWGILMPLGALIARYLKVVDSAGPAWFYLHMACQHVAYVVGVTGWVLGLRLGSESVGIQYSAHRYIGIVLFSLGTLQVFALLLRPSPDHKYRFYWNIYHRMTGYTVIVLSVINVFKGLDILDPEKNWKLIYVIIISVLGVIAINLEVYKWIRVMKMKKNVKSENMNQAYGVNGVNGYSGKPRQSSADF